MIVQCPSCSKRYRVDDSNIPPSGGKIRCPECSHAFVVYPDSDETDDQSESQSEPSSHEDPGAKTSVAERPNMQELLNKSQGGEEADQGGDQSPDPAADDDEEVAKTEVMEGDELPDFNNLFGEGGPPEDDESTVEMDNPLESGQQQQNPDQGQPDQGLAGGGQAPTQEDDLETEQLDSDVVDQSLGHVRDQADSSQPVDEPPDSGGPATQVTPPPNVDEVPDSQNQQRASSPDHPTPPPSDGGTGPGQSGSLPGQSGGAPGQQGGNVPGQQGGGPGQSGNMPGQQGGGPGQSGNMPGQQGGGAAGGPDQSGGIPGQQGGGPGQSGNMPGQQGGGAAGSPGQSGNVPGQQSGNVPGQQGGGPGQSGNMPGQQGGGAAGSPGQSGNVSGRQGGAGQPGGGAGDGAAGPDPNHNGPWKLETSFGLTYEFADTESLRDWLDGKDDLDGYQLSADEGDNFYPLDEFPQVTGGGGAAGTSGANAQMPSSGQQPPSPGAGSGQQSPSPATGSGQQQSPTPGATGKSGPVGTQDSSAGSGARTSSGAGSGRQPSSPGSGASRQPSSPGPSSGSGPLAGAPGTGGGSGGHSPFQTASGQQVEETPEEQQQQSGQKEKIDPDEKFEPPSRDSEKLSLVLWGTFIVLAVAAVLLALELVGVLDLRGQVDSLMGEESQEAAVAEQQQQDQQQGGEEEAAEPESADDSEEAAGDSDQGPDPDALLEEARAEFDEGNFGTALDHLEEAREADPEFVRLYDLKADVHEKLGEQDQAEQTREVARHLREEGELPDETPQEEDGE